MGEVFAGRYELVDPIGRGGVGAVWRAWDHRRRRYVAAKVLQQSDAHSLLRFVREQAFRIDHPHVLAPASWAADDDKVLFTMDLVAGGSLVHLVGDYGPLPPSFVCTLLGQLLAGLAAVHTEGVVHRDIKPANLLLEATGTARPRLRLSDFGIAMRLGEPRLTETNLVVGTPGYLAPEQLMGAEPDFPADLFAVGLVALYLLEGAKPDVKALVQYFAAHGTLGAPKGVPEPLWQVVASLVQPDPHARFRTATGARKALASAAELLPEPGPDDELIEIFDQIGPLPPGFGPDGPLKRAPGVGTGTGGSRQFGPESGVGSYAYSGPGSGSGSVGAAGSAPVSAYTGSAATGTGTGSAPRGTESGSSPSDPRRGATGQTPGSDVTSPRPTPAPPPAYHPGSQQPAAPKSSLPVRPGDRDGLLTMSDTGSFLLPPPAQERDKTQGQEAGQAQEQVQGQGQEQQHAQGLRGTSQAHHDTQPHSPQSSQLPRAPHSPHPDDLFHTSPYDTTHVLSSPQPHTPQYPAQPPTPVQYQRIDASPAAYTTPSRPDTPSAPSDPQPHRRGSHRAVRGSAHGPAHRPGPPAKVAVPLLLLALACYAVGLWALTRV